MQATENYYKMHFYDFSETYLDYRKKQNLLEFREPKRDT